MPWRAHAQPCPGCFCAQILQCGCLPSLVLGQPCERQRRPAPCPERFQTLVERGMAIPCSEGDDRGRSAPGRKGPSGAWWLEQDWEVSWGRVAENLRFLLPYSKLGSGDLSSLTSCPAALSLPFWRNLKWPLPALSHYAPAPTPQGFQFFKPELRPVPSQQSHSLPC